MSSIVLKWLKLKGRCFYVREVGVPIHYTAEWKPGSWMDRHTVYVLWKTRKFEFTTQIHIPILVF